MEDLAGEYTQIASTGFALLGWLSPFDADLVINAGLPECQLQLDPDLVEILLERPEPPPANEAGSGDVVFDPPDELRESLAPLHDFLSAQPEVRAAWLFTAPPEAALPPGHGAYTIGLLMADPEDERFLDKAAIMAKALTPVEMEWSSMLLMADGASIEKMATRHRPFYAAPGFAKSRPSH